MTISDMSPLRNYGSQIDDPIQDSDIEERQHANSRTSLLNAAGQQSSSISQKTSNLLQDWWLWEILSSFVSLLSILSIVVILIVYDSSSLPDWPFVFNVRQHSQLTMLLIGLD